MAALRRLGSGARVTWRDRATGRVSAWEADHVIVTVPLPVVSSIDHDLSPKVKAGGRAYLPAVKTAFQAQRRWWEQDHGIYGGISWTTRGHHPGVVPERGHPRPQGHPGRRLHLVARPRPRLCGDDTRPAGRRDAYPALLPPDGPYWFAGEHVSHLAGWQEGSIRATHHVLERIQARVAAGRTEGRPG
ncbi:FAD-dependent oxidoreductase [Nonomuraea sp. NPDC005692]|uniref:FAD-dependent oxidoreductase n=1 Tax=Nonomuraea sp. NPDC005692 TaxID=3157168 RepID=UPI003406AEAF